MSSSFVSFRQQLWGSEHLSALWYPEEHQDDNWWDASRRQRRQLDQKLAYSVALNVLVNANQTLFEMLEFTPETSKKIINHADELRAVFHFAGAQPSILANFLEACLPDHVEADFKALIEALNPEAITPFTPTRAIIGGLLLGLLGGATFGLIVTFMLAVIAGPIFPVIILAYGAAVGAGLLTPLSVYNLLKFSWREHNESVTHYETNQAIKQRYINSPLTLFNQAPASLSPPLSTDPLISSINETRTNLLNGFISLGFSSIASQTLMDHKASLKVLTSNSHLLCSQKDDGATTSGTSSESSFSLS